MFQDHISIIHPGEYSSSNEDIIISTVLESCIAVALYDPVNRQGGLNHFMLPGNLHGRRFFLEETAYLAHLKKSTTKKRDDAQGDVTLF